MVYVSRHASTQRPISGWVWRSCASEGHVPRLGVRAVRTESCRDGSGHRGAHDRRRSHASTKGGRSVAGQDRMTIEEVVRKVLRDEHADVICESVRTVAREVMEAEVAELIGAELGERRPEDRATHRNGYRARRWDTRPARSSCRSRSCGRAAISRASCSPANAASRRWCRWSSRPTCAASRRAASISSSRALGCASAAAR
jgi:hypothetical protein